MLLISSVSSISSICSGSTTSCGALISSNTTKCLRKLSVPVHGQGSSPGVGSRVPPCEAGGPLLLAVDGLNAENYFLNGDKLK